MSIVSYSLLVMMNFHRFLFFVEARSDGGGVPRVLVSSSQIIVFSLSAAVPK